MQREVYTAQQLADRFGITRGTIYKYVHRGILPPSPGRGGYGQDHVKRLEYIWGRNGLKDRATTLVDLAERPWDAEKGWDVEWL